MTRKRPLKFKILAPGARLPEYQSAGAAGMDFYSPESATLLPGETRLIGLGLSVEVWNGYELQIRSRSGLALKHGVFILNGVGTIDSDYRGEIGAILHNSGPSTYEIRAGERICQGVINVVTRAEIVEAAVLSETKRGTGGFGSTGYTGQGEGGGI